MVGAVLAMARIAALSGAESLPHYAFSGSFDGWLVLTMLLGLGRRFGPFWRPGNGSFIYFEHKEGFSDLHGINFAHSLRMTANRLCVAHFAPLRHEENRSHYQTVQAG